MLLEFMHSTKNVYGSIQIGDLSYKNLNLINAIKQINKIENTVNCRNYLSQSYNRRSRNFFQHLKQNEMFALLENKTMKL